MYHGPLQKCKIGGEKNVKYPMQMLDNAQYRLTCAIRLADAVQVCMDSGSRAMEECAEALYGANYYLWSLNSEMREAIDAILEERSNSNGEKVHEGQGEFDQQGEKTSNRALSEEGGESSFRGLCVVSVAFLPAKRQGKPTFPLFPRVPPDCPLVFLPYPTKRKAWNYYSSKLFSVFQEGVFPLQILPILSN